MAKVTRHDPPPQPPETYTVELTRTEARALTLLLGNAVTVSVLNRLHLEGLRHELNNVAGSAKTNKDPRVVAYNTGLFQSIAELHPDAKLIDD